MNLNSEVATYVMRVNETEHWLKWQDEMYPVLPKTYKIGDDFLHIPNIPGEELEWNEVDF